MTFTLLSSVGCMIDQYGNTYVASLNDTVETFTPNENDKFHLDEITNPDWWDSLSPKDKIVVTNIYDRK